MSPTSYQTAPPRNNKVAEYRDAYYLVQASLLSLANNVATGLAIFIYGIHKSGAEGETRTRTGISPLPPQGSVSTNFTTSAFVSPHATTKLKGVQITVRFLECPRFAAVHSGQCLTIGRLGRHCHLSPYQPPVGCPTGWPAQSAL